MYAEADGDDSVISFVGCTAMNNDADSGMLLFVCESQM